MIKNVVRERKFDGKFVIFFDSSVIKFLNYEVFVIV